MGTISILEKGYLGTAPPIDLPQRARTKNCQAHITVVGLSYKTAPVHLRERLSYSKYELGSALPIVNSQAGQSVILSTCNRTEVYSLVTDLSAGFSAVRKFLAEYHRLDSRSVSPYVYEFADVDAARHLHLVACGLDSMVLGERQILEQVRAAMHAASKTCSTPTSAPLSRLFHSAIKAGWRVQKETALGQDAPSMGQAAVELARRLLGNLDGLRVLLIGTGNVGKLVAREFVAAGVADLVVVNRTEERGAELAKQLGAEIESFSELGRILRNTDIVICASSAPDFVVTHDMVAQASQGRVSRPMYLFDLTVPRNVDPSAGMLNDVYLFNVDDIGLIAWEKSQSARTGVIDAEEIVEEELTEFLGWWDTLESVPMIKNLQAHAESVRLKEIDRAMRKMPNLAIEHQEQLEAMTRSLVKKVLHGSIEWLKNEAVVSRERSGRETRYPSTEPSLENGPRLGNPGINSLANREAA